MDLLITLLPWVTLKYHSDCVWCRTYENTATPTSVPSRAAGNPAQLLYYLLRGDTRTKRKGREPGDRLQLRRIAAARFAQRGKDLERQTLLVKVDSDVHVPVPCANPFSHPRNLVSPFSRYPCIHLRLRTAK